MSGSEIKLGNTPNLDESLYSLNPEETAFYQAQTGIQDEQELKAHIMSVQRQAFAVHPYPCIQRFAFTRYASTNLFHACSLTMMSKIEDFTPARVSTSS
jgi:hypothetical protein